jgi:hypothetical protein
VDWSWELLDADEQDLLACLSVFPGEFDAEAAAAVAGRDEAVHVLSRLVDRSLVRVLDRGGDGLRYRLLETIRQYGREKLDIAGNVTATRERHLRHFLADRTPFSYSMGGSRDWDEVWIDRDNYRAALLYAVESRQGDVAVELCARMFHYWNFGADPSDTPTAWVRQTLSLPGQSRNRFTAHALIQLAWGTSDCGPWTVAMTLAQELDDGYVRSSALGVRGILLGHTDLVAGRRCLQEALEAARSARARVRNGPSLSPRHGPLGRRCPAAGRHRARPERSPARSRSDHRLDRPA